MPRRAPPQPPPYLRTGALALCLVDRSTLTWVTDAAGTKHRRVAAVGAVANKMYKSGRIIPMAVQRDGIKKTQDSGRQLTAYIEHPGWMDGPAGNINECAAIVVDGPTLDEQTGETKLTFQLCSTPAGDRLAQLLDSGVEMGVSQRALGREEVKALPETDEEDDTPPRRPPRPQVSLGRDGYFRHLRLRLHPSGRRQRRERHAGPDRIRLTLAALAPYTPNPEDGDSHMSAKNKDGKETPATPAASPPAVLTDDIKAQQGELLKTVTALHTTVQEMATKLTDKLAAPESAPVRDAVAQVAAAAKAIHDDANLTPDEKNTQLQEMSVQLSDLFSKTTGVPVNAEAVAKLDSLKAATSATATLADAMKRMLQDDTKAVAAKAVRAKFDTLLDTLGGPDFSQEEKTALRTRLAPRLDACTTPDQVQVLVEDSLAIANLGRAKERLLQLGYQPPATPGAGQEAAPVIDTSGDKSHFALVHMLHDKMVADGFEPTVDLRTGKPLDGRTIHPAVKKMVDRWDELHAGKLARELALAKASNSGRVNDAMLAADIDTPYTLIRSVITEAYSDDVILGVVTSGTMQQDRDQIAITRWRRASTNRLMRVPNAKERNEIVVPELNPIPEGKLVTDYVPMDAKARKLRALMSDEFITRSRRRPELGGIALAAQNLIADIKRCLGQDIFYMMLKKALLPNAVAFTSAQDGTASQVTYQVTHNTNQVGAIAINPATAVMIVPETLAVTVNDLPVPEWGYTTGSQGGGPSGVYFFTVDHAMGKISFVDALGNDLPPPAGTGNVKVVAGKKAGGLNATRVDLTPAGSAIYEDWINKALFAVQNLAAAMPTNVGYEADFILQSLVTATTFGQARAYTPLNARPGFTAGNVRQGAFGRTANMDHFASVLWPNNITIIGSRDATQYRVFEPMTLRGPIESRDEFGHPNAGKEWYSYQEDAMDVPVPEKLSVLVTYAS